MKEDIRTRLIDALSKLQVQTKTYGKDSDDALVEYADALAPHGKHALMAIIAWPLENSDWPALKELLDLTGFIMDQHRAANVMDHVRGLQTPVGKFINQVLKSPAGGEKYVSSWLNPNVNCAFTDKIIFTTGIGTERLKGAWKKLLILYGVRVEYDPEQDKRLEAFVDRLRDNGKLGRTRA